MDLVELLTGLASGALTVPIVSLILNQLSDEVSKSFKRGLAIVLSFLFGMVGYMGLVWLGYKPEPSDGQAWMVALMPVMTAAFTASQVILSAYKEAVPYKFVETVIVDKGV